MTKRWRLEHLSVLWPQGKEEINFPYVSAESPQCHCISLIAGLAGLD